MHSLNGKEKFVTGGRGIGVDVLGLWQWRARTCPASTQLFEMAQFLVERSLGPTEAEVTSDGGIVIGGQIAARIALWVEAPRARLTGPDGARLTLPWSLASARSTAEDATVCVLCTWMGERFPTHVVNVDLWEFRVARPRDIARADGRIDRAGFSVVDPADHGIDAIPKKILGILSRGAPPTLGEHRSQTPIDVDQLLRQIATATDTKDLMPLFDRAGLEDDAADFEDQVLPESATAEVTLRYVASAVRRLDELSERINESGGDLADFADLRRQLGKIREALCGTQLALRVDTLLRKLEQDRGRYAAQSEKAEDVEYNRRLKSLEAKDRTNHPHPMVIRQSNEPDAEPFWGCSEYPSCHLKRSLSAGEKAYLDGRDVTPAARPAKPKRSAQRSPPPSQDLGEDQTRRLFDALTAWRTTKAKERGVPAYVIASDDTLAEIARGRPRSLDELLACKGIGQHKRDSFGEDLLAIVNEHL